MNETPTKEFFEKLGFDVSKVPYTLNDNKVYPYTERNGAWIFEKPIVFSFNSVDDFLKLISEH